MYHEIRWAWPALFVTFVPCSSYLCRFSLSIEGDALLFVQECHRTKMELMHGFCKIYGPKTINVAYLPFKNIFILLGCFYTQQLSSTSTNLHKRELSSQGVFPK